MTYPTISHFIEEITGFFIPLPIQTFGFFIVLAFIVGHYFIKKEFLRLEKLKLLNSIEIQSKKSYIIILFDYLINIIVSFFFGYKILFIIKNYSLFAQNPQEVLLSTNGNVVIGLVFSFFTITHLIRKHKSDSSDTQKGKINPSQLSWNLIFIAGISGIIGAKLFSVFENIDLLLKDPLTTLFSFSGLTFYGGLIMGTLCVILYAKKHNINVKRLADIFAPALILAYGIGRMGCHFSGDGDWGIISKMSEKPIFLPDWLWGYQFPHNVIEVGVKIEGCVGKYCHELPYPVYPTSLYETIFCITIFLCLWKIKNYITTPGIIFCLYLIFNGIERFFIETIRVTEKYHIFQVQLTQAQIIAILITIIGIFGIYYLKNKSNINEIIKE